MSSYSISVIPPPTFRISNPFYLYAHRTKPCLKFSLSSIILSKNTPPNPKTIKTQDALISNFIHQKKGKLSCSSAPGKEQAQQYFLFSDMEMVPATVWIPDHSWKSPTRFLGAALFRTPPSKPNDWTESTNDGRKLCLEDNYCQIRMIWDEQDTASFSHTPTAERQQNICLSFSWKRLKWMVKTQWCLWVNTEKNPDQTNKKLSPAERGVSDGQGVSWDISWLHTGQEQRDVVTPAIKKSGIFGHLEQEAAHGLETHCYYFLWVFQGLHLSSGKGYK